MIKSVTHDLQVKRCKKGQKFRFSITGCVGSLVPARAAALKLVKKKEVSNLKVEISLTDLKEVQVATK